MPTVRRLHHHFQLDEQVLLERLPLLSRLMEMLRYGSSLTLATLVLAFAPFAAVESAGVGPETGLALPRFVSLKADVANVRRGPSVDYPIQWIFKRSGIPLEIIAEFHSWRKIRDCDGMSGWIHRALLSSARTAWVSPWNLANAVELRAAPRRTARIMAMVEPKVLVRVVACDGKWCSVSAEDLDGYVSQDKLCGVYPHEEISDDSIF